MKNKLPKLPPDGYGKKTFDNIEKYKYIDDIKKLALELSEYYASPIQIQINVKSDINQVKVNINEINI